jgi:hypothetical protein
LPPIDHAEGELELLAEDGLRVLPVGDQIISTLPSGFAGSNSCSGILVSADGKLIYAGNRQHDSIGILSVGSDAP